MNTYYHVEEVKRTHNCKFCGKRLKAGEKRGVVSRDTIYETVEVDNMCPACFSKKVDERIKELKELVKEARGD
jgi:Zn finger protein HypA/HybF involved in hydrogenase expression